MTDTLKRINDALDPFDTLIKYLLTLMAVLSIIVGGALWAAEIEAVNCAQDTRLEAVEGDMKELKRDVLNELKELNVRTRSVERKLDVVTDRTERGD